MVVKKLPRNSLKLKGLLVIALLAGLLSGLFLLNRVDTDPNGVNSIGDRVDRSNYSITVNSSRFEDIFEPNSGTTLNYVVADLTISNTSQEAISFIPVFQAYIRTEDGTTYEMSPYPGIQPIYAGDIEPNTSVSGELSFFVPSIDQQLTFFFDPGWDQQPAVFVEL